MVTVIIGIRLVNDNNNNKRKRERERERLVGE